MATGFNTQTVNGNYRIQFETDNNDYYQLMIDTARRCVDGKPMTNADRYRSMSDEELAEFLIKADERIEILPFCQKKEKCLDIFANVSDEDCMACMMEYLKQPAKEDQWTE